MSPLTLSDVQRYVEEHIGEFHTSRLVGLGTLRLDQILKQKNPYLYKAKNIETPEQLVRSLMDARLSSQEEGVFGNFLERLAGFVCAQVYGGRKSGAQGIDIEMDVDGIRYAIAVKSGPNWGNSSQVKQMIVNFQNYRRIVATSGVRVQVEFINGCCYGRDSKPVKVGGYRKLCGQAFWEFISGNSELYLEIVEPLGRTARERNEEFASAYVELLQFFNREFVINYTTERGAIDWERIVRLNSAQVLP